MRGEWVLEVTLPR